MPHSVESLREQIARETLARGLAAGHTLADAARAAGIDEFEAADLAQDPNVVELVRELDADAARKLTEKPPTPQDPLAVLEAAMPTAAQTLIQSARTPSGARLVLELGAKLRQQAVETPARVIVKLTEGQAQTLIDSVDEFNSLIKTLISEDQRARKSA